MTASRPRPTAAIGPTDVLAFWRAAGPDKWFNKDAAFDAEIATRFLATLWRAAAAGRLADWEATPEGALALSSCSTSSRATCSAATRAPMPPMRWRARSPTAPSRAASTSSSRMRERQFFYLPFMHSEDLADQERCLALARGYGRRRIHQYAEQHADIIRRFGRFPHRNAMLGRATTAAEQAFLDGGGFAGEPSRRSVKGAAESASPRTRNPCPGFAA